MTKYQIHYPDFNVMDEKSHWDPHTLKIVSDRLETETFYSLQYLTRQEANTLTQLCSILLDDDRSQVIAYVIHHFDSMLKAGIGESQRKIGVPQQSLLIRDGLALLNQFCTDTYGSSFDELKEETKIEVINEWILGNLSLQTEQKNFPVKDFMQKILNEATAAYYSHPIIWSEIGYAGPAYPRGYVRSEFGLTDPWEAKRNGK